jgi:hypothetical protein
VRAFENPFLPGNLDGIVAETWEHRSRRSVHTPKFKTRNGASAPVDMFCGHTRGDYFSGYAGDIDAYAMRAVYSSGSSPSAPAMSAVKLRGPFTDALLQYSFVARSDQG